MPTASFGENTNMSNLPQALSLEQLTGKEDVQGLTISLPGPQIIALFTNSQLPKPSGILWEKLNSNS